MGHEDSLLGRLESVVLALDQLKSCLEGVEMEVDQGERESDVY